jgi:acyl carrier protein phosphodiesterase
MDNSSKLDKSKWSYDDLDNSFKKLNKKYIQLEEKLLNSKAENKKLGSIIDTKTKQIKINSDYLKNIDKNEAEEKNLFNIKYEKIKESLKKALSTISEQKSKISNLVTKNSGLTDNIKTLKKNQY